jgi:hypothetical protein
LVALIDIARRKHRADADHRAVSGGQRIERHQFRYRIGARTRRCADQQGIQGDAGRLDDIAGLFKSSPRRCQEDQRRLNGVSIREAGDRRAGRQRTDTKVFAGGT